MGDSRLTGFASRPAGHVDRSELAHRIFAAVRFLEVLRGEVAQIEREAASDGRNSELELELGRALRTIGTVDAALRHADRLAKP